MMKDVEKILSENVYILDEKYIEELNEFDSTGGINNVLNGIRKEVICVALVENTSEDVIFELYYITDINWKASGYSLSISIKWKNWADVVLYYCKFLSLEYENTDALNNYNAFLDEIRTGLEKINFLTYTPNDIERMGGGHVTMIANNKRGIIRIPFYHKKDVIKIIFGDLAQSENTNSKIYIMYNYRNDLTKIGLSKNPKVRERTLQGEDPQLFLAAIWEAPKSVEKELHMKFKAQRERGEWFKLKMTDWVAINDYMEKYK